MRLLITFFAAIACVACSPEATITRRDGARLNATITSGDESRIFVRLQSPRGVGAPEYAIDRSEISDIDHPGDGMMAGGTLILVPGLLGTAAGLAMLASGGDGWFNLQALGAATLVPSLVLDIIGGVLIGQGARRRAASKRAAGNTRRTWQPTLSLDPGHASYEAGLQLTF